MTTDRYTSTSAQLHDLADWLTVRRDEPGPHVVVDFLTLASRLRRLAADADTFAAVFDVHD